MEETKKKIFLVEDTIHFARMLKFYLEKENFALIHYSTTEGVLEGILLNKPDMIILDIALPGKDGFTILQEIKSNETIKDIPVMMLTSYSFEDYVLKSFKLGAVDYMTKAIPGKELMARIKKVLSEHSPAN